MAESAAQAPVTMTEPTQKSLDAALLNARKLTIIDHRGKLRFQSQNRNQIAEVKSCLQIVDEALSPAHYHGDLIFYFETPTGEVKLYVESWKLEWSKWYFLARLKTPNKLESWLRHHIPD